MSDDLSVMGNFKGVMLCNRPAQIPGSLQTLVGPTASSGPSRPAFVSSVVPETQLGLPPVRTLRAAPQRRDKSKTDDVTWRHKKWLGEFAERRQAIEMTMEQRVQQQQEKQRRFQERSQAMRDAIRGIKNGPGDKDEKAAQVEAALTGKPKYVPTEYVDVSQQYPSGAPQPVPSSSYQEDDQFTAINNNQPVQSLPSNAEQPASSRPTAKKSTAKPAKPGWARTEAEADEYLDAEADNLIDFAASLDYNKYIDDLEVREAIKFVQDRVKGLEESKQTAEAEEEERQRLIQAGELEEVYVVDDTQPLNANGEPVLKKIVRRVKKIRPQIQAGTFADQANEWDATTGVDNTVPQSERDRRDQQDALTKTVLDSNRAMRNVHSSASVRAIMEKEEKAAAAPATVYSNTGATTLKRGNLASVSEGGEQQRPPVITTIHESDSSNRKGVNPSNLPFLYRHPGI